MTGFYLRATLAFNGLISTWIDSKNTISDDTVFTYFKNVKKWFDRGGKSLTLTSLQPKPFNPLNASVAVM